MEKIVVDVETLGKRYALSHQQRTDSIKSWLLSAVNRAIANGPKPNVEEFWAIRGVSFQVHRGECRALVGKNGSGKSTLLKILSRIIPPTEGRVRIRGRIASLLEVGTGFHPELTGRENIFLNAAMLGCAEREAKRQFDAIVDFSGVERFLDTPVKRYSNGMYVRLAYAVSAHVSADMLVIDEVLAVGDHDFQRKCMEHLKAGLSSGRSAIIVSHDLSLVRELATHVTWLQNGRIVESAPIESDILQRYSG
ncbi:ABC transporter ATP-binding protein [Candidatus Accumulibacter sp. ACC003]|uniref:ABC transporter ATP-binding protein n=1 Tax=Candidatus Accumulibacter sp. ACC003 TaxID=2823334 RepID=UPI0025BB12C4|nr:ABC transporter ATP-binding protein [Candidatus Accumulibacter sp. ACC003]